MMADDPKQGDTPPEAVVGGSGWHPLATAAVVGGALAATAGAYLGTRALARRNGAKDGKVSSVMATAMTAIDLAQHKGQREPSAAEIVIAPPAKL
jgi:hypothetical protein